VSFSYVALEMRVFQNGEVIILNVIIIIIIIIIIITIITTIWPRGPPNFLQSGYQFHFPGVKATRA